MQRFPLSKKQMQQLALMIFEKAVIVAQSG
jgi:hypothetical protein